MALWGVTLPSHTFHLEFSSVWGADLTIHKASAPTAGTGRIDMQFAAEIAKLI
jgi:hypothetical protein